MRDLGIELLETAAGRAVTRLSISERHLNFNGVGQGGLTFTPADAAFGYACNSQGIVAGGIDAHIAYVPVRAGDILTATATEISCSDRLSSYRVDVTRADGTGKPFKLEGQPP